MLHPHNVHSLITLKTIKNNSIKFSVTTGNPKFLDCPLPLESLIYASLNLILSSYTQPKFRTHYTVFY